MHCTLTHEKHRSSQKSLICNPIEEGYFKRSEEVSPEVGGIAHNLRRCMQSLATGLHTAS